jgi:hypothetical protein
VIDHLPDRVRYNAELGAFAAGMNQAYSGRFWIENVNRAAVSDVNTEHDTALIRDDAIAAAEFTAHRIVATAIDNCDLVSVNLLRREQPPIANADGVANFVMRGLEPLQYFCLIVRNVDARNSLRKSVSADSDGAQRWKLLERKVHGLSLKIPSSKFQSLEIQIAKLQMLLLAGLEFGFEPYLPSNFRDLPAGTGGGSSSAPFRLPTASTLLPV